MARRIGMRDIHIATVTTNTSTAYATDEPVKLANAVKGKVAVKRSNEPIHSDDELEETITTLDGIDVEIEVAYILLEKLSQVLGCRYEGGLLIDNETDQPQEIALGWRAKQSNGKYEFIWLYCGKLDGDDEENYETKGQKPNPQSKTLKGTFYARKKDGDFRIRANEGELLESHTSAKAAIEAWFTKVPEEQKALKVTK